MMAEVAVRLQRVRIGDLPEFARRALEDRARYEIVPITVRRAQAQAQNPAASPDDVGLIVAYLDEKCIGYLGMFPAWLGTQDRRRKVFSLSTYFVGPEYRASGAGPLLLMHAVSLGHDLFVAGFTELAGRIYRGVGFRPVGPVALLNLRLDAALVLPLLLERLRHGLGGRGVGAVARAIDGARRLSRRTVEAALRPLVIWLLLRPLREPSEEVIFSAVESVRSPETSAQDGGRRSDTRFLRDDAAVNWMIRHPWIAEDPSVRLNYAFSYRSELFRFLPFQLRSASGGHDLGYVVLRVSSDGRRTVLKILDHVLADERLRRDVLRLALLEARRWSVDRIECGEEFGLPAPSFLHGLLLRRDQRGCLLFARERGGPSGDGQAGLTPGVCDGDAPFV